ncbi:olfactory receptor 12D3-like [Discoglossus pictus]
MYLLNLMENIGIIIVVILDLHLHTPMYFLLSNLSFFDIFYSSTTVPKMCVGLVVEQNRISFQNCLTQLFFFHFFGCTEALLLSTMAYDSFFYSLTHTVLTSKLPFCNLNTVSHFFCDIKPLLKLACAETHLNESLVNIITGFVVFSNFLLILTSYILIGIHLLNIRSLEGHHKAFTTCSSHLMVVLLYFGSGFLTYLTPSTKDKLLQDRQISVLYTVITPVLNPLIYTLKNKEAKPPDPIDAEAIQKSVPEENQPGEQSPAQNKSYNHPANAIVAHGRSQQPLQAPQQILSPPRCPRPNSHSPVRGSHVLRTRQKIKGGPGPSISR